MNEPRRCALLDIPIDDPYRDYGLDLSHEALEGPERDAYPFGVHLDVTVDRRVVHTNNGRHVTYVHDVLASGPWQDLDATFSREGVFQKVSKFFGRAELQGGDPLFDDNVFIKGDPGDQRLYEFVSIDGVQSALLALLMGTERSRVTLRHGEIHLGYTTGEGGEVTSYKDVLLPVLALAKWATTI